MTSKAIPARPENLAGILELFQYAGASVRLALSLFSELRRDGFAGVHCHCAGGRRAAAISAPTLEGHASTGLCRQRHELIR